VPAWFAPFNTRAAYHRQCPPSRAQCGAGQAEGTNRTAITSSLTPAVVAPTARMLGGAEKCCGDALQSSLLYMFCPCRACVLKCYFLRDSASAAACVTCVYLVRTGPLWRGYNSKHT
jgi:hypothetical protein